jgi:hypothetical protein
VVVGHPHAIYEKGLDALDGANWETTASIIKSLNPERDNFKVLKSEVPTPAKVLGRLQPWFDQQFSRHSLEGPLPLHGKGTSKTSGRAMLHSNSPDCTAEDNLLPKNITHLIKQTCERAGPLASMSSLPIAVANHPSTSFSPTVHAVIGSTTMDQSLQYRWIH